jgi:hypothetical protein
MPSSLPDAAWDMNGNSIIGVADSVPTLPGTRTYHPAFRINDRNAGFVPPCKSEGAPRSSLRVSAWWPIVHVSPGGTIMAKNRNQNRDRTATPSRGTAAGGGEQGTTMEAPPQSPAASGLNQEMSRKRKKKFGHN